MISQSTDYELVRFTSTNGDAIVALFGHAQDAAGNILNDCVHRPTMLYFYGNSMSAADCFPEFNRFRSLGFNVMIPDYPGFGMSSGKASEFAFYCCATAAFENLKSCPDIDPTQIIIAGWSLGAAVATDLAARKTVMGLAIFSGFTSWTKETREHFFWLPASLLLDASFDSESKFRTLRCPAFIAHGIRDSTVPFAMAKSLAAACRERTVLVEVNSDHADIFEKGGAQLGRALTQFAADCRKSQPK